MLYFWLNVQVGGCGSAYMLRVVVSPYGWLAAIGHAMPCFVAHGNLGWGVAARAELGLWAHTQQHTPCWPRL